MIDSFVFSEDGKIVHISQALTKTDYKCPGCDQAIGVRHGRVRQKHFWHKYPTDCQHYTGSPGEGALHRLAKTIIKEWLEKGTTIDICEGCTYYHKGLQRTCGSSPVHDMLSVSLDKNDIVVEEWIVPNGRVDLAVINDKGRTKFVFEVCHTHKTEKERPEPWIEADAKEILEIYEEWLADGGTVSISNIRERHPRHCLNCLRIGSALIQKVPYLQQYGGSRNMWKQTLDCICCGAEKYSATFDKGYRAICKMCAGSLTDEEIQSCIDKNTTDVFADLEPDSE